MTITRTMLELVANQDMRLMRSIQRWRPPRWVRVWMLWATRAGDGWAWCAFRSRRASGRRRQPLHRSALGRDCGGSRRGRLPRTQAADRPQTPLGNGQTFLGLTLAARSILVPFRSHHYGFRGGHAARLLLPFIDHCPAFLRSQRGGFANRVRHAFLERCLGRMRDWLRPGMRRDSGVLMTRISATAVVKGASLGWLGTDGYRPRRNGFGWEAAIFGWIVSLSREPAKRISRWRGLESLAASALRTRRVR